ncbi:MAG: LysR family transcriptional regulator [Micropruina sp.]|uniref:LysR family transcriptional regulator n=1 Tax=Micropruina sp. TaxID=2737536 RepID=UPI0039E2E394
MPIKSNYLLTPYQNWYAIRWLPRSFRLPYLKLSHLRLVAAIAEHGQIQMAAQALTLTQPAASRALAEIEKLVGAPLFERHPRGMTPTTLGAIFVRRAHAMLMEMQDLSHELQAEREGRSGLVQIGAVTGPAVACLVPAARKLKADNPKWSCASMSVRRSS